MKKGLLFTFLFFIFSNLMAQKISISPTGGISKPIGTELEYWNMGFSIGAEIFVYSINKYQLGLHISYNKWSVNDEQLLKELFKAAEPYYSEHAGNYNVTNSSGNFTLVEIIPTIRIPLSEGKEFLLSYGGGLFILNHEASVSGSISGSFGNFTGNFQLEKTSETRAGLQIGLIMLPSKIIEINAYYNYLSNEFNYFTINLGIPFSL